MNMWKPVRFFLKLAMFLAILAAFAILDWYPTVKELGRLRRQHVDLQRRSGDHAVMASRFVFPDAEEQSLFSQSAARLRQSLPRLETDAAWLDIVLPALARQARADRIGQAYFWVSQDPGSDPKELAANQEMSDLNSWLAGQRPEILSHFRRVAKPAQFPWSFMLSGAGYEKNENLASRPLVVLLSGGGSLKDFINRCSWSDARLEIVHLQLDVVDSDPRVWMICRGQYLVRSDSPWVVACEKRSVRHNLLIDPDSPLLWQKVDPGFCPQAENKELAMLTAGSR